MRGRTRAGAMFAALCLIGFATGCKEDKHDERQEATAEPVKLAMDPDDLMKEGALAEIQKALGQTEFKREWAEGKLDQETSTALRKFQESKQLPATGIPDEKTVQVLGLKKSDIFIEGVEARHARGPRARTNRQGAR